MNVGDIIKDPGIPNLKFTGPEATLGNFISQLFVIAIFLAVFLAFFWLVWGAFQYMVAGGNKEKLAQARSRITWAIVGLILTLIAFLVAQFAQQIVIPQMGTPLSFAPLVYAAVDIEKEYAFGDIKTLGQGVNRLVIPVFSIAIAVVVIYFLIGAFRYLTSAGDKEAVASARNMITHAIIGFFILMFTFLVLQFLLSTLFGVKGFTGIKDLNIFGRGGP